MSMLKGFYDKNGQINFTKIMWTWYFVTILPLAIINWFFVKDEEMSSVIAVIQLFCLIPFVGLVIFDLVRFRARMKRMDRKYDEHVSVSNRFASNEISFDEYRRLNEEIEKKYDINH